MFTLFVSSASVAVEEKEVITAGRVGLQCSIRFSPDWDGLVKTAVFDGAESRDVIVTGERVTIPAECLAAAGDCLKAGFYGKSTDGAVVIPTVWASLGMIEHSVYPSGREGAAPTPDVVAQIQQAAANAEKMARSVREDADLGRLAGPAGSKGEKGDKGDKGDKGADGKSAYAYAAEGGYTGTEAEFAAKLAAEKLANPNALTFTGAVTGSYDGSAAVSVEIPSGGGSGDVNHALAVEVLASGTVNANSTDAVNTGVTLYTLKQYKLFLISVSGASNTSLQNWYTKVGNISIGRVNNFRAQTILYEFLNDEKTLMIAKSGTSGNHSLYLNYFGNATSYGVVNAAMFADCVYDLSSLSDDTPVITYPTGASIDVNWSILGVTK